MATRETIYFPEIASLRAILEEDTTSRGVFISEVIGKTNDWLNRNQIPSNYAVPLPFNMARIEKVVKTLMNQQLLKRTGGKSGLAATDEARRMFDLFGDDWSLWPLSVEVVDGVPVMETAKYATDFRRLL